MDAAHACVNNGVRAVLCLRPTLIKLMRTGNPVLNDTTFREATLTGERRMTLTGTVNATLMFVTLLLAAAMFTWNKASVDPGGAMVWVSGGAIAGLILALVTVFKKNGRCGPVAFMQSPKASCLVGFQRCMRRSSMASCFKRCC